MHFQLHDAHYQLGSIERQANPAEHVCRSMEHQLKMHVVGHAEPAGNGCRSVERHAKSAENACRSTERQAKTTENARHIAGRP